jgi:hypothetical protein
MANFFNFYPLTVYSNENNTTSVDVVTNITTRFGFLQSIKEQSSLFYEYSIKDTDTPEGIAFKVYGDPEKHWIVLLFNDIIDPQFDWPLSYDAFNDYVDKKYSTAEYANNSTYGAGLAYAKNVANVKERVKIVERQISGSSVNQYDVKKSVDIIQLDANTYANVVPSTITKTLPSGMTVKQTISKQQKTYYDYEYWENEGKRNIVLLQPFYVETVMVEFEDKVSPA